MGESTILTRLERRTFSAETRREIFKSLASLRDQHLDIDATPMKLVTRENYKILLHQHRSEFTGKISVGTPEQTEECIMDTGSSTAWIFSTKCTDPMCVSKDNPFDSSKSSTYIPTNHHVKVTFGSGSLTGQLAVDTIKLGGVTMLQQGFGEILKPDGSVFEQEFGGICGLSFPMSSHNISLLEGLRRSQDLTKKSITFYYGKEESAMFLGEPKNYGSINWYPVSEPKYWETPLKDVTIQGKSILGEKTRNFSAVFDTGTSILTTPSKYLSIAKSVLEDIGITCQMIQAGQGPKICYHFDKKADICIDNWFMFDDDICKPALVSLDLNTDQGDIFILGQPFLWEHITTYDFEKNRVGVTKI
eukprot:jgi/Bigna1/130019/aug1.10_g4727